MVFSGFTMLSWVKPYFNSSKKSNLSVKDFEITDDLKKEAGKEDVGL
jgi:hypothetical protein